MAVSQVVAYADVDALWLDPTNPRLGRKNTQARLNQDKLLRLMREWNIEELATSFMKSGFWTQEAIIVVSETQQRKKRLVVVEGNRRIAALKTLKLASEGHPPSPFWRESIQSSEVPPDLFTRVPYYLADNRSDVDAYLGFRHVTGIKQWDPAEKAEYIGRLVDKRNMDFDEIRRAIGSKTPTVRLNYIAYRVLLQFDESVSSVPADKIEDRFSVMYLCLRDSSVRRFLGISETAGKSALKRPVPARKLQDLEDFGVWLFGTDRKPPLFTDSRQVSDFARALGNSRAVKYLRTARKPTLDQALRHAGLEMEDLIESLRIATDEIEQALSRIHLYLDEDEVRQAVERFALSAGELVKKFEKSLGS